MRFEELRLIAYGPFTDCAIPFGPGLNVIYGPNEAGKSSALRAVHALLFGVESRTTDNFVHSYTQLRIGATLVDARGQRLECVRRKGRRSTLRDGNDDQPMDEALLETMLGGVNAEFFASVFGIDHERLRDGGEEVVRGEGRVGELLFAAGGVVHLREKQLSIDETASNLFKPNGKNPRINSALRELKTLKDDIRQLQRSPEQWAQHDAERRRLVELESKLRKELAEVEADMSRLDRFRNALRLVGSWKQKRSELDALADIVILPDDAEEKLREASQKRTLAEAATEKATLRAQELTAELEDLHVPESLLNEAERIDELYRRLGNHDKESTEVRTIEGQQRTVQENARRTIEKLGWDLSIEEAGKHRIADEKKARVRALANRHREVTQAALRQQQTLEQTRKRHGELQAKLAKVTKIDTPVSLKKAISAAASSLEVEERINEQLTDVERLKREATDAAARLPLWEGSIEDVSRLEVPSSETVDEFEQTSRDLATERLRLDERIEANEADRTQATQELSALELAESVPTEDELTDRRNTRDKGIRLAVQKLRGEQADDEEIASFVREVGEADDVASSLQPSVEHADVIADRLRRESNRVAQKSQLLARLQTLDAEAEKLTEKRANVDQELAAWETSWQRRWDASGIAPSSPSEMRGWLRRHAELVRLVSDWTSTSERLASDQIRLETSRKKLADELLKNHVDFAPGESLHQLIDLAENRVNEVESAERARENLVGEVTRANSDVQQTEKELEAAETELNNWRSAWQDAMKPLRLEVDALPEQAEATLANVDELFRNLDAAVEYQTRIWVINENAREFAQAATDLATVVAPDLADRRVEELVVTLNQRLSDAKQVRQQVATLLEQLNAEKVAIEDAERDLSESAALISALVAEANCAKTDELPSAIERSRRKKRLEKELADFESQLMPLCAGQPLPEFVEEALNEDGDRLPNQIAELSAKLSTLRSQFEATIAARERESAALDQYDGSAAAAEKADERQSVLARLEEDVREYVVATVASRLLQRAVERYQERSQGPVLAGASTYFEQLTCGSFCGLRTDYDESGQDVVVGLRPDGGTLPVEAMSDGARDQLYLALRLGTLDHWFEEHESIPFVVDDILLTFDDARATAALKVLANMSAHNQVLFFTHHEHLVDLAREVGGESSTGSINVVTDWDR